jgi:hypothetical protein
LLGTLPLVSAPPLCYQFDEPGGQQLSFFVNNNKGNINMKRILLFTILALLYTQESISSFSNNNNLLDPDANRLRSVLCDMLPDVRVDINGDQVELTGQQPAVDAAIAKLRDFPGLRAILLPPNKSKSLAVKAKDVKSWDDFLEAAGVDESANELFNTKAECVTDKDGVFTISTPSKFNQRMVQPYLDSLHESSPFFVWARTNVKGFVVQQVQQTSIHYGLMREFLYLQAETSAIADSSEITSRFSTQNAVKTMVAAVNGYVALKSVGEGQYQVQTMSLGEAFDTRSTTLEIMVDNSGSMSGEPISFVNAQLPVLLAQAAGALSNREALTVRIKCFNNKTEDVATVVIKNGEAIPRIPYIDTEGSTDLTLIEPLLEESNHERKMVIAFTDGDHTANKDLLTASIARMHNLIRTGKIAQARLCKVGTTKSDYFARVAAIFGGTYATDSSIQDFFSTIIAQIKYLMRAKSALVLELAGAGVAVAEWMPDDVVGIFSSKQIVGEGSSIKFKGETTVVDKPEAARLEKIAELEAQLAALKEARK